MIAFIAQTVINPGTQKFFFEETVHKEHVSIINGQIAKLIENYNPVNLKTIELQIMFDDYFFEIEILKQEQVKQQSVDSGKLIDDVLYKLRL